MKPPVIIGLLVLIAAVVVLALSQRPGSSSSALTAPQIPAGTDLCTAKPEFKPLEPSLITSLSHAEMTVGTGDEAQPGKTAVMNYTGYLPDGTVFDSSCGKQPFPVRLGAGQVIAGWDQGIPGMKVGGKRRLFIPSDLGYGPNGNGPIPGNSPLIFDVELVSVQ